MLAVVTFNSWFLRQRAFIEICAYIELWIHAGSLESTKNA